ncbi:MAG: carboxypeptidase regulatory-like domain-containing protein [Acidobacteria bacterium]|nr:carboxypeptidase regulatory-like domain-containing protein [Acidobacteriota bacterium]
MTMRTFYARLAVSVLCLLTLLVGTSLAQSPRGSIGGIITDPAGGLLAGVRVTISNEQTGSSFETISSHDGTYLAPQLLPGSYRVKAERAGFTQLMISHVQVNIDQAVVANLDLKVGDITETITVEAAVSLIDVESGSVGYVVQNRQIVDLPLNGRNVFDLLDLTPGSFRIGPASSIAGGRTLSASARLDGVFDSRGGLGIKNIEMSPPVDSMQEFKVHANSMSTEFGRTSSGLINATTKSGTNQYHGSVYEFLRNDLLDSRGWGVDEKAPLRRNQFGATFGGPIRKNKTLFFYNYDGFREHRADRVRDPAGW